MVTLDYYKVLGISKTADNIAIKAAYRSLALIYHPDHSNGDKDKEEKFKEINEAYAVLSDSAKRKNYDDFGNIKIPTIPSRKGEYKIKTKCRPGDLSEIYLVEDVKTGGLRIMKVAKHPSINDLLKNEADRLKALWKDGDPKKYGWYYLPQLVDDFKVDEKGIRRQINVLDLITDYTTMDKIREMFPNGVQLEHGVWMFNRMLEGLTFFHKKNQIHGSIVPSNIMVWLDPKGHLVKFLDWGYAGQVGEPIKAICPTSVLTTAYLRYRKISVIRSSTQRSRPGFVWLMRLIWSTSSGSQMPWRMCIQSSILVVLRSLHRSKRYFSFLSVS